MKDFASLCDKANDGKRDSVLGTHEDGRIDQAMWLYFLDNFRNNPRNLVNTKRSWDPQNYFHSPQSILFCAYSAYLTSLVVLANKTREVL